MTAINFPASPNPGDKWPTTGNIDGKVWAWDGTTWKIVSTNGTVTIIDNTARSFAFTVTYTNVPGSYNVVGTDRNGEVSGLNPTITVNEEDTLIFNVNASGHPFYLVWQHGGSSNQVGGGQGTNTASNQGTVNGTVTWVTDVGDGDALPTGELFYYQCGNHTNMYGTIKVLLKNTSDSASHIHDLIDLDDTPNAYDNGKYLKSTTTGTEWATVSGGGTDTTYEIKALDNNDDVNIQIDASGSGTDSSVKIKSGNNITLDYINAGEFEISATGEANVQSDWTQTTTTADDYIKNKPGVFQGTDSGLVPTSSSGTTDKFLRSDGTWQLVSSGGSADGNDYVTGANLGTGADAKKLTLSFGDTSLNQTVDLSSIDTQFTTEFTGTTKGLVPSGTSAGNNKFLKSDGSWADVGGGETNQNAFSKIAVSGQSDVDADAKTDTVTFKAEGGMTITTDASGDEITFSSSTASGGETNQNAFSKIAVSGQSDVDADAKTDTLTFEGTGAMTITTDNSGDKITFDSVNTTYSDFAGTARGLVPSGSSAGNNKFLRSDGSWADSGGGEVNQNAFSVVSVSGQSNVSADGKTDTLTFAASGGMSITTNSSSDIVTFSSSDTTYSDFTGSGRGLVPNGSSAGSDKFLRSDGSWADAGGSDTNYYVSSASWSSSNGQLTLNRSGGVGNLTLGVSNLQSYFDNRYSQSSGGIDPGTPNATGAVVVWNGSSWTWSRTALINAGTSSNNTNLEVDNLSNGYGGMKIQSNGEILLKKAGSSWREGGHLQFESESFTPTQSFAIDMYNDTSAAHDSLIRVIDQTSNTQRFAVNHYGAWGIGHTSPNFGSSGQVMISQGEFDPPVWGNHSSISGSAFASTAQGATADTANTDIDNIYTQLNAIGNDASITTVAQIKAALAALVRG